MTLEEEEPILLVVSLPMPICRLGSANNISSMPSVEIHPRLRTIQPRRCCTWCQHDTTISWLLAKCRQHGVLHHTQATSAYWASTECSHLDRCALAQALNRPSHRPLRSRDQKSRNIHSTRAPLWHDLAQQDDRTMKRSTLAIQVLGGNEEHPCMHTSGRSSHHWLQRRPVDHQRRPAHRAEGCLGHRLGGQPPTQEGDLPPAEATDVN